MGDGDGDTVSRPGQRGVENGLVQKQMVIQQWAAELCGFAW